MKHIISYENMTEPEKSARALADVQFWLGARYEQVSNTLAESFPMELESFAMWADFVGLQGFPVKVWYADCAQRAGAIESARRVLGRARRV